MLSLPAALCADRAAARVDHEGGLDGPSAKSVVHRMCNQLAKAGLPQISEGLASVMVRMSSGAHPHHPDAVLIGIQTFVLHTDGCTSQGFTAS